MAARSASAMSSSFSIRIVFPASTASTAPLSSRIILMVSRPTAGTSKRRSCCGLLTLTATKPSLPSSPPRRIAASVPSTASTATTTRRLTTTHCPMPSRPISLAVSKPERDAEPLLDRRRVPRDRALAGNNLGQKQRRFEHADSVFLQLPGHAAQQLVVLAAAHAREKRRAAEVGAEIGEQLDLFNAADHDGLIDAGALKRADDLSQLADVNPRDVAGETLDLLERFAAMGDGNELDAFALRLLGEDQREPAVAGDEAELTH